MSKTTHKSLSPTDVVSVSVAARALHIRDSVAAGWLRKHGLVLQIAGRQRVIWGDVLEAARHHAPAAASERTRRPATNAVRSLPRMKL
jgi:hypothetical protein